MSSVLHSKLRMVIPLSSQIIERLASASWWEWVEASAAIGTLWFAANVVYNVYFHPLRHFPGPRANAASNLPWGISLLRGVLPHYVLALHHEYGPVVRLRPGELSFVDPAAWQDIYGHKVLGKMAGLQHGARELPKSATFYKVHKSLPDTILSADRETHARHRKMLFPAFSEKSMRAQEPLVTKYVDLLMIRLRENSGEGKSLDLAKWLNWTTFDIIGDLAFGESFRCLEESRHHRYVTLIFDNLHQFSILMFLRYIGQHTLSLLALVPMLRAGRFIRNYSLATLEKRIALKEERPDLIQPLLTGLEDEKVDMNLLQSVAETMLTAGSETTASLLSGVSWLLVKNPDALARLQEEVRGTFRSEDEITFASVQGLTYMLACLNEGLRLYPPVALGLPREVPKGGAVITGNYVPEGTVVSVSQWAVNHMPSNWTDPWEFRPERFLGDGKYSSDNLAALKPFSLGPRDCIGKTLAYVEMRVILARIVWNFDMKRAKEGGDWIMDQENYLLWQKPPVEVILTPVER